MLEIWQMTLTEYITSMKGKKIEHRYYNRLGQLQYNHHNHVEWAMQLGRPVPKNVSILYPDLLRKYKNYQ